MSEDLSKLINLINTNKFLQAEKEVKQAIDLDPENFILNKIYGIALLAQKKYNSALPIFNKCYDIKNDDYDINVNISYLFLKSQDYEMVIKFAKEALNVNSNGTAAYQNLAECYLSLRKFDEAKEFAKKAIELRGGPTSNEVLELTDLLNLYADILIAQNNDKEFINFTKEILDSGSYQSDLFKKLLRNNISNIDIKYIKVIENIIINKNQFKDLLRRNSYCASAHFCLAEYYSKKSDQSESEKHFIEANNYISDMQRTSLFNRQKMHLNIVNFFKDFDTSHIVKEVPPKKGDGLIFIFGMPRSGTTLTESILSTAPNLVAGGEKVFFSINLTHLCNQLDNIKLDLHFFVDLGDRYLKNIELQRDEKKFFIDKLPENYIFYKFIKIALPGAKFIHLRRDPWDNAISLFKEYYADNIYFASSFFGIALEIANHDFITDFWKNDKLENGIFTLKYEDLVSNTEDLASQLWQYCGLEGRYLPEMRKSHFAATASRQQVKQEIFKTSLKKKEFLEFKDKFFSDLNDQKNYLKQRLK